ncbi:hypothetical protein L3X38_014005 [Prunus dulcis]|uniref:Uncharacterized protein n=1 Tax=Prunus dulcis TaxID=3755 RepID=A0AAD4WPT3_PRUDU|nr:hypothetical protein L3X38_014005 [Prunus dulcis]
MALVAKLVKWHGGNTLTHMAKIIQPIFMISLVMAPTKRIIQMAIMAKMFLVRPPIPPTPLEESEVSREYESEKEMGDTTLGSNVQVDRPIESLTLVEEKESTQGMRLKRWSLMKIEIWSNPRQPS